MVSHHGGQLSSKKDATLAASRGTNTTQCLSSKLHPRAPLHSKQHSTACSTTLLGKFPFHRPPKLNAFTLMYSVPHFHYWSSWLITVIILKQARLLNTQMYLMIKILLVFSISELLTSQLCSCAKHPLRLCCSASYSLPSLSQLYQILYPPLTFPQCVCFPATVFRIAVLS